MGVFTAEGSENGKEGDASRRGEPSLKHVPQFPRGPLIMAMESVLNEEFDLDGGPPSSASVVDSAASEGGEEIGGANAVERVQVRFRV